MKVQSSAASESARKSTPSAARVAACCLAQRAVACLARCPRRAQSWRSGACAAVQHCGGRHCDKLGTSQDQALEREADCSRSKQLGPDKKRAASASINAR